MSLFATAKENVVNSGAASTGAVISGFRMVDLSLIDRPKDGQPRTEFNDTKIQDLAESISSFRKDGLGVDGTGLLQPIGLAENPESKGRYVLVYGERRLLAFGKLSDTKIPAYVSPAKHDRKTTFIQAIAENDEREFLSVNDETMAHVRLVLEFGLDISDIARRRGKSVSTIREILKRHEYGADIWEMLEQQPLSKRAARDIHSLPKGDLRTRLIERVKDGAPYAEIDDEIKAYKEQREAERLRQDAESRSQRELRQHAANDPAAQPFARTATGGGKTFTATGTEIREEPTKLPRRPFKEVAANIEHATAEAWDICKSVPPSGEGRRALIKAIKNSRENLNLLATSIGMEGGGKDQ